MAGLPVYIIEKRKDGWLFLSCPRRDCSQMFAVVPSRWAKSWKGQGRACPYCFRPSKMPAKRSKRRARSKSAKVPSPAKITRRA